MMVEKGLAMLTRLVVFVALGSVMTFPQVPTPRAPGPSQPAGNSSRPDAGPTTELRMKSIDQVLHDDAQLSARLQDMLPVDMRPQQACTGFKTLEQCVTAIHLAQNLKLPFPDLKAKTTGKGSDG